MTGGVTKVEVTEDENGEQVVKVTTVQTYNVTEEIEITREAEGA